MRILFVYPNLYTQMGFNHGLASLSACLKERGHETRLVNLNENLPPVPSNEDVAQVVRDWAPGMIAFSCLTQQYASALERSMDGWSCAPIHCSPTLTAAVSWNPPPATRYPCTDAGRR